MRWEVSDLRLTALSPLLYPHHSSEPRAAARKPRVGFVVQRAASEVVGGAESLCLQIAQRMSRDWQTEVLTTCALDYMTWDNHFPAGLEEIEGTSIRRFRVDSARDVAVFNRLSAEIVSKGAEASFSEQEAWMRAQGPFSTSLLEYLAIHKTDYDAFIFFGYLYATTYFGLPLVKEKAVLAPLAHDEWPIHLPMWDSFFSLPLGYVFQTPEELQFLRRRFPALPLDGAVAGIGVDQHHDVCADAFREKYNVNGPFLLYVGRIDASKGCGELFDWFVKRDKHGIRHKLVVVGREVLPVPFDDGIIYLGVVSEQDKFDAMAACDWMILPSQYESLSLTLLETWSMGRPAVVNGNADVLVGHCRRSGAGLWYASQAELEVIVQTTPASDKDALGESGRTYVTRHYSWPRIQSCYLQALDISPHSETAQFKCNG